MRITNFNPYSKNTPSVSKRAPAAQMPRSVFAEHRQTAVVHQIAGSNNIKCTSSQLETVSMSLFASVSAAYKLTFKIRKKGQNTHLSATLPVHATNRYLSKDCGCCSPHSGALINSIKNSAIKISSNSAGLAQPIAVKNKGNE